METYRGGTTDPCIVCWPDKITARGEIRTQYAHIIDFVPTVLDALGIKPPAAIRGVTQAPIEGVSFAHTFDEADAETRHHTQYYEMFGHRSIYHDGWRAVCPWPGPNFTEAAQKGRHYGSPIDATVLADIEAHDWELYDLTTDYAETKNLAAENRDKVIEMVGRWWAEAGKYNVMPIDGSMLERMNVERPTIAKPRDSAVQGIWLT
jgi:arylsulfatase A-like enzyme